MPRGNAVDGEYIPEQDELSINTTPSSRVIYTYSLSDETKDRVRSIDPNKGRCLIENCVNSRAVDFCHCVARKMTNNSSFMDSIEWYWNMKYYSLNLDSSHNIFRAGSSMHRLFDRHDYLLLPPTDIIDQYYNTLGLFDGQAVAYRKSFPIIPDRDDWQYRLIPLSQEMREIAIHRQNQIPPLGTLAANHFATHVYPFLNTMPALKSHLHPRFVILEGGIKLTELLRKSGGTYTQLVTHLPVIRKVLQLYNAWTVLLPADAGDDKSFKPDSHGKKGGKGGGADDTATDSGRRGPYDLRSGKKRGGRDESPTPGGSQNDNPTDLGPPPLRKKNSTCLSEKTLIEHERMYGHKKKWSPDAVQAWFKEVLDREASPPQMSVE